MAVVFVHGVNNRTGASYDAGVLTKEKFFRKHLSGATVRGKKLPMSPSITFPYWGGLATEFRWNMASLPRGEMQNLGGAAEMDLQPLLAHVRDAFPHLPEQPLTTLAKERLSLAVDVVNDLALQSAEAGDEEQVSDFVVRASAYAEANPHPAWLADVESDEEFLTMLQAEIGAAPDDQALGGIGTAVFNKIKNTATKFKQAVKGAANTALDKTGDFVSTKLLAASRDSLNATLGRFFGDVFIYTDQRGAKGTPGAIPTVILKAFDAARQVAPAEPFVIVGHSLGGVITYDLLSHFRPDIEVDLLVTVGSQVAHFEEIKLYRSSDPTIGAPKKVEKPKNIHRWINVYDEVDIFSYAAKEIFEGVDIDARYDTQTYTIKAHGAYFEQDRFYERLRARIGELKP